MVLYRLAHYPSIANRFCARVTTEAFIEKCTQVMGRPHLSSTICVQRSPKSNNRASMSRVLLTLHFFRMLHETDNVSTEKRSPLTRCWKPKSLGTRAGGLVGTMRATTLRRSQNQLLGPSGVAPGHSVSRKSHANLSTNHFPTWKHECHFRAGEELWRAGQAIPALQHCAAAGTSVDIVSHIQRGTYRETSLFLRDGSGTSASDPEIS